MTNEEINNISTEYAKSNIPNGIDEEYARSVVFHDREMFGRFLQWLSKNYAIVPKSKVKERYEESKLRSKAELKFDILIGNSRVSLLESLFNVDDL